MKFRKDNFDNSSCDLPRIETPSNETEQVLKSVDFGVFRTDKETHYLHNGLGCQVIHCRYGYLVRDFIQYTGQVKRPALHTIEKLLEALDDARTWKNWK